MLKKTKEILEGYGKYFKVLTTDHVEDNIAKERAAICGSCPFAEKSEVLEFLLQDEQHKEVQGYKCTKCGCPLSAKIRSTTSKCPEDKWPN